MLEKNHGHIVSLASIAGVVGAYQLTDYCASKFGAGNFLTQIKSDKVPIQQNHSFSFYIG